VHDSLILVSQGVDSHTEFLGVVSQGLNLSAGSWVNNRQVNVLGWSVVILSCDCEILATQVSAGKPQAIKGLWASYFVD
jgi:hypothetical protein